MAPVGRPPADHVCGSEGWIHRITGIPFDARAHAKLVRAKKLACLRAHYWHRGGRDKRLRRYTRKRPPKTTQLKLLDMQCVEAAVRDQSSPTPR